MPDTKERKMIIRQYYIQLYGNQLKYLEKIFEFLGKYQLTPKERDILNRQVVTEETVKVKVIWEYDEEYLPKSNSK